mgnify:FL=1|jgi:hypothetical protein
MTSENIENYKEHWNHYLKRTHTYPTEKYTRPRTPGMDNISFNTILNIDINKVLSFMQLPILTFIGGIYLGGTLGYYKSIPPEFQLILLVLFLIITVYGYIVYIKWCKDNIAKKKKIN